MTASPVSEVSGGLHFDSPLDRGPVLRAYRRRAFCVWLAVAMAGLVPALLSAAPALRAFGLGLWFPGAGFLYTASPHFALLALLLFVVSLASWLIVGGFIFPVLVWLGAAAFAAQDADGGLWPAAQAAVPLISAAFIAWVLWKQKSQAVGTAAKAAELKRHLQSLPMVEPELKASMAGELSVQDLGALRFILDRTLQPIDRFDGFTTIDQFREAAWRYQLVSMNYALAAVQTEHLPAFGGYLAQAQQNAIRKMTDPRVWKYWRFENLVGNLKFDGDPIRKENVMYSGWWALALGAYERATGDVQFSRPGALTLSDKSGRRYVYDYRAIVDALVNNFDSDRLCFFPCEPNWVFSVCNLFGMTGVLLFDREHATRQGLDRLETFNRTLEREFTLADGRAVAIASKRSGFVLAPAGSLGLMSNAWLVNMVSPRLAQVYWQIARHQLLQSSGGRLDKLQPGGAETLDPGNYRKTGGYYWAAMMTSAREMGDEEVYAVASRRYDDMGIQSQEGALAWTGSVFANAHSHVGRFGRAGTWHRFAHGQVPAATRSGPMLAEAAYPQVLVAFADNDGERLDLVLRAGKGAGLQRLVFGRLKPGVRYRVEADGEATYIEADGDGGASVELRLGVRTQVSVFPNNR